MNILAHLGFAPEYASLLSMALVYALSLRPVVWSQKEGGRLILYPKHIFSFLCVIALCGCGAFILHGKHTALSISSFVRTNSFLVFLKASLFGAGFLWCGFRSKIVRRALERDDIVSFSYAFFASLHLFSCLLLLSTHNLLLVFLICLLQSVCWLFLHYQERAHNDGKQPFSTIVLYEVLCLLVLLIGIMIVFSGVGRLGYGDLSEALRDALIMPKAQCRWTIYGPLFVGLYFLMKLSAFPFCTLQSSYFLRAPRALLAITSCQKFSLLFSFAFFLFHSLPYMMDKWQPFLFWVGLFGLVWFSAQVFLCESVDVFVESMMGFSVSVTFICLSVGQQDGLHAAIFYFGLFFLALIALIFLLLNISVNDQNISSLSELKGLSHTHPVISVILAITLLSFAAFPPFAGFWTSLYVLKMLISKGWIYVAIMLVSMVVCSFRYFHVMRLFYMPGSFVERRITESWKNLWLFIPLFFILFPLCHRYVIQFINKVTESL